MGGAVVAWVVAPTHLIEVIVVRTVIVFHGVQYATPNVRGREGHVSTPSRASDGFHEQVSVRLSHRVNGENDGGRAGRLNTLAYAMLRLSLSLHLSCSLHLGHFAIMRSHRGAIYCARVDKRQGGDPDDGLAILDINKHDTSRHG